MTHCKRTYEVRTDSHDPTVACLLACHDRQPADQRHGPGNGPGSSRKSSTLSRPTSMSESWSSTARSTTTS